MTADRLAELESRIAELESFKEKTENFMRDYKLRNILYEAWGALKLTQDFEGNQQGYYCRSCFVNERKFNTLKDKPAKFQQNSGQSTPNAECTVCGQETTIGTNSQLFFK